MESNRHFNVVVVGDNHEELMAQYDSSKSVEPRLAFEFSKVEDYRKKKIKTYEALLKSIPDKESEEYKYLSEELNDIREMDDVDFFIDLTSDDAYEIDEEGNAYLVKNIDGKFDTYHIAKHFAVPFKLKNGEEAFSAKKRDIDWKQVHLANEKPFEIAWDTVVEHKKPETDEEKLIYNNMKERSYYFSLFGNRENYIKSNTAFW